MPEKGDIWRYFNMETDKESTRLLYSEHEKELIELILGIRNTNERKSSLQLALESARFHCGINKGRIDTATFLFRQNYLDRLYNDEFRHFISDEADIFSALLSYLICLEQIGTIFYLENKKNQGKSNGIINAINIFSPGLSNQKCIALKNLRNSLGHAYGLVNIDYQKKGTHKFTIDFREESKDIIKIPDKKKAWDGNYLDKNEESSTIVYVFPLIRFIEKTIQKVINEYHNGNLRFIFYEEIKARFTVLTNN